MSIINYCVCKFELSISFFVTLNYSLCKLAIDVESLVPHAVVTSTATWYDTHVVLSRSQILKHQWSCTFRKEENFQ